MSEIPRRAKGKERRAKGKNPKLYALCSMPYVLCPILYALAIFLLCKGAVYGTADHERQDMSQRARAALEEILSTEEFKDLRSSQSPWRFRPLEGVFDQLLGETRWAGVVLEWLLYLIGILMVVFVFALIAKRFRRLPSFRIDHGVVPAEPQHSMDPEALRMQAYECSQRSDYRRAIRYLYLSFLLYLDRAGLFAYDAGKTNGEYLSETYYSMGDEAERFASLTLFFERKWYGMEESSAGDFQQCEEWADRLMSLWADRLKTLRTPRP